MATVWKQGQLVYLFRVPAVLVELHEEKHSDFPFLTQAKTTLNNTRNLYPVCANKQHLRHFHILAYVTVLGSLVF